MPPTARGAAASLISLRLFSVLLASLSTAVEAEIYCDTSQDCTNSRGVCQPDGSCQCGVGYKGNYCELTDPNDARNLCNAVFNNNEGTWQIDCTAGIEITEALLDDMTWPSPRESVISIDLSTNERLLRVPAYAFQTLVGLKELRIADCGINEVDEMAFDDLPSLELLDLGGNPLLHLYERTFSHSATKLIELDISRNNLTTVPKDIFKDLTQLTYLHMHTTNMLTLPPGVFSSPSSLYQIEMQHGRLGRLQAGTFDGLTSLVELEIDHNWLTQIDDMVFKDCSSVEDLYLHNNKLTTLTGKTFNGLSKVKYLSLSYNRLDSALVSAQSFAGLASVERLMLDHNSMDKLHGYLFADAQALKSVDVSFNGLYGVHRHTFHGQAADSLKHVILSNNEIDVFPQDTFHGLASVILFDIQNNKLKSLPPAMFDASPSVQALFLDAIPGLSTRHYCALAGDVKVYIDNVEQDQTDRACKCKDYENHACPRGSSGRVRPGMGAAALVLAVAAAGAIYR